MDHKDLRLLKRLVECVEKGGGKRALSSKAGISEAQLYRYLKGTNDIPLGKLKAISEAAGVDLGWLVTGLVIK